MWSSHDSEFEIIQSVLDVESMMAQGATKKRYWRKVYAMNSREKMERKWEHQILFNSIQILEYPQARVYLLKIQEIHLSLFFESLVTRQDWRIRRRRIGRPGRNICRPNQPGIIKITSFKCVNSEKQVLKLQNHQLKDIRNKVRFPFQELLQNICTTNKEENRFQPNDDQGMKHFTIWGHLVTTFEDLMKFSSSFWAICIRKYRDEETYSDKKENIR